MKGSDEQALVVFQEMIGMSVLDDFQDDFVVDLGPDITGLVLRKTSGSKMTFFQFVKQKLFIRIGQLCSN